MTQQPNNKPQSEQPAMIPELRVQRLVVGEITGPQIIAEIINGAAELRIELPHTTPGQGSHAIIYASSRDRDTGATLGIELRVEGNDTIGLTAWQNEHGTWEAEIINNA